MEDDEGVVCVFPCCDKAVFADADNQLLLRLPPPNASVAACMLRGVNNVRSCARLPDFAVES